MKDIVLASSNPGKVREINQLLAELGMHVQPQSEFGVVDAEETGLTFVENAILKARNAAQHTGLPAIADDSGLEVDALAGAPGIYSARFAGEDASDQANLEKLLVELEAVPEEQRTARFQCLLVFMRHANDPTPLICQGIDFKSGIIGDCRQAGVPGGIACLQDGIFDKCQAGFLGINDPEFTLRADLQTKICE